MARPWCFFSIARRAGKADLCAVALSRSYASCIREIRASMLKTRSVNDDLVHIFYVIMDLEVNQSGQLRNLGS